MKYLLMIVPVLAAMAAGAGGLAPTPPMGWTTWNAYTTHLDQEKVRRAAHALVEKGLAAKGYRYVNIDSGWQGPRTGKDKAMVANARFPDMKGLVDEIHGLGLKAGIYSTPMVIAWGSNDEELFRGSTEWPVDTRYPVTHYGGCGKTRYEGPDARQWAEWGFDYLKYDWFPVDVDHVKAMREALDATGREFVLSLCTECQLTNAADYVGRAQVVRGNWDMKDDWKTLKQRAKEGDGWLRHIQPNFWYDLDMLALGPMTIDRKDGKPSPNRLTKDEQVLHFLYWVTFPCPLILSCDLPDIDDFTLALVSNEELIALDQDPLGEGARFTDRPDGVRVAKRRLSGGRILHGFFNFSDERRTFVEKLPAKASLRDPHARRDLGVADAIAVDLAPHAARLVVAKGWAADAAAFAFTCAGVDGRELKRVTKPLVPCADGAFEATVRRDEIPAGTATVEILPDFARARTGDDGYAVTSDGFLASFRAENGEYVVDGWPWNRNFLPLFGMKTAAGRGFAGIVRTLREEMRVKVTATNGVYTVSPVFELFRKVPEKDLVVDYYPLAGIDASYAGMARLYRREQLARGAVRPLAERAKTQPELAKAARNVELRIRLGWKPVPSPVLEQTPSNEPPVRVAATFARCRELVRRLCDAGTTNVEICLVGWQKGGHDGCWPQVFPVEPALGGEAELRALVAEAKAAGMQIVGHTNSTDGYTLADCWDWDLVSKDEEGRPRKGDVWGGGQMYWLCPKRVYERFYPQVCRDVGALGFRGLQYVDVMTFLPNASRCLDPRHPLLPEEAVPYYGRMMRDWRAAVGGFASEGPWDVNAGDLDFVLYCCFETPKLNPLLDRAIPLWQLVYNGIILQNPFTSTVNACCKPAAKRLKLAEFNGRSTGYVHSRFVSDGGDWMSKSDAEDLRLVTSADLDRTVRLVTEMAREYAARADLQFVFMEDHEETSPGVFTATYSNGVKTVTDYVRGTFEVDR